MSAGRIGLPLFWPIKSYKFKIGIVSNNWPDSVDMILSNATIVTQKPIINTYFLPFSWKYLFFVNHLLIYINFTLLEQMIRNTMLISLTFSFIKQ